VIHHVRIEVSDLERSGAFYDAVLAPLGWRRHTNGGRGVGWGIAKPWFFAKASDSVQAGTETICFTASGVIAVRAAWEGGVGAGGVDDGKPSQRPEFGSSYYSAYLRDPDGYRIEIAVAG
jgi:catechol 2,3-dioxygenase-like lactoylglutathione lyase family enzyme